MLTPRRLKYRKQFGPSTKSKDVSYRGNKLAFGDFGLRAEQAGNVSSRQIESARRAITHFIKRGGKVWIRIFPDKPTTKKPPETRMGSGKGDFFQFVAPVAVGRVLFEMGGVDENTAREALRLASYKLPIKSSFLKREEV